MLGGTKVCVFGQVVHNFADRALEFDFSYSARSKIVLNEHVLNKYSVRTRYFRESRSMRAEYKRGVVRPEVLDHAHKYGG